MKEFNAEAIRIEMASALETVRQVQVVRDYPAYIGLDVHKETIVIGVAEPGRGEPMDRGEIAKSRGQCR